MPTVTLRRLLAPLALLVLATAALRGQAPSDDEDWAKSPQAYFLTAEEKREWQRLGSRSSREEFIERYWLKRDPSAGTPANEFRDLVLNRIRTADSRYRIEKTPGSRTAQGFVFIVFGTPARVEQKRAVGPEAPRVLAPGDPNNPVGLIEGTEHVYTWFYERERTPRVLEALGIPTLSIEFVVEPHRHHDELQKPGLVNDYREVLARKTIVNPDLVPGGSAQAAAPAASAAALLPLSAAARALLERATPQGTLEDEKRPVFGSAILWGDRSTPETVTWAYLPAKNASDEKMNFHALVRPAEGGPEVLADSEPVATSSILPTAKPGRVVIRRLSRLARDRLGTAAQLELLRDLLRVIDVGELDEIPQRFGARELRV
ncbi:MAG TPA: GWxTD domain-containing protein, partial [Thermoanaerobaculia bacterium]|nr:GWxTD domain-containing protein [Thermoanaerobaculia bacterium]